MIVVCNLYILTRLLYVENNLFLLILLENFAYLNERITLLSEKCIDALKKQGFSDSQLHTEPFLHLRYDGTDCALMCSANNDSSANPSTIHGDFLSGFLSRYTYIYFSY